MCEPRHVTVTATRSLDEAWHREVTRIVELRDRVVGEARVRQPLDATLGTAALRALESAMAAPSSGWATDGDGFRYEVEGGYALYLPDQGTLEIVATLAEDVEVTGVVTDTLEGRLVAELEQQGRGDYYGDGFGGRTEAVAQRDALANAHRALDRTAREELERVMSEAERTAAPGLEAKAREQARSEWQRKAEARREELADQARQRLEAVGLRVRQAFNRTLALAYRDAILAYAKSHRAEDVSCSEDGDVIEIEFRVQR